MKFDFSYHNPTKIYFGKNAIDNLDNELKNYGDSILLVYGKSSIKKIGLYDTVISKLKKAEKKVTELSGVKSNPTYKQMMEGIRLARQNDVKLILAVGGGSVIDCAKAISVGAYCEGDPWQKYWVDFKALENEVIPVASILTMTGTASEMNGGSVITHEEKLIKEGRVFPPEVYPKFSILNPEYTYSVPKYQMASGIFDCMSHLMEQYFSGTDYNTTDCVIEGIMEALIISAYKALENPLDYEARSNIMWCSSMALNYISGVSKEQDWEVHNIEHQIGAYTDCAHGAGLAAVSIPYYKYIYPYGIDKFVRFAEKIWNVDTSGMSKEEAALSGIDKLKEFIKALGLPQTLRELGVSHDMLVKIAGSVSEGGGYKKLNEKDVLTILNNAY